MVKEHTAPAGAFPYWGEAGGLGHLLLVGPWR